MKRCHEAESIDDSTKRKITDREYKKRCHEADSIDVAATGKKIIRENMKRYRMAESCDAAAAQRSNDNTSKKRKQHGRQHNVSTVCHDEEMTNAMKRSMKKAKQILHRTHNPAKGKTGKYNYIGVRSWFLCMPIFQTFIMSHCLF